MEQFFSDAVRRAIRLIWMQYKPEGISEGARLLHRAADEGDAQALCFEARTHMGGRFVWEYAGFEADDDLAVRLLREAVRRGSACAVLTALRCGELTPSARRAMPFVSPGEARDAVFAEAQAGHPFCQYMIGSTYLFGDFYELEGLEPQKLYADEAQMRGDMAKRALPWLHRAYRGGLDDAGVLLYRIYGGECGLPAERERQARLVRMGAERGSPLWQERLGDWLLWKGKGAEALEQYLRAADGGQLSSWHAAGAQFLEKGDILQAVRCLERGAAGGVPAAQCVLGEMLHRGTDVPQDFARAAHWLTEAARRGERQAYPLLGQCFLRGLGVKRDCRRAQALFLRVLEEENGHEEGILYSKEALGLVCNGLGEIYAFGLAGETDAAAGMRLFRAAARCGNAAARDNLSRVKRNLFERWRRSGAEG